MRIVGSGQSTAYGPGRVKLHDCGATAVVCVAQLERLSAANKACLTLAACFALVIPSRKIFTPAHQLPESRRSFFGAVCLECKPGQPPPVF